MDLHLLVEVVQAIILAALYFKKQSAPAVKVELPASAPAPTPAPAPSPSFSDSPMRLPAPEVGRILRKEGGHWHHHGNALVGSIAWQAALDTPGFACDFNGAINEGRQ